MHLSKLEQPDVIRRLVLKLPFSTRVRWRRAVTTIMEDEARSVKFRDFVKFVDQEARINTNPVFGRIVEDSKPKLDRHDSCSQRGFATKRPGELSFAAQVSRGQNAPANTATPRDSHCPVEVPSCLYCNTVHTLENCSSLRSHPYADNRILKVKETLLWLSVR